MRRAFYKCIFWGAFLSALAFANIALARGGSGRTLIHLIPEEEGNEPWYTGPLLAPSGHTLPKGWFNIQPYIYYTKNKGTLGVHGGGGGAGPSISSVHHIPSPDNRGKVLNFVVYPQWGITDWMDTTITIQGSYQEDEHRHSWVYNDMAVTMGFQLLTQVKDTWKNDIKLSYTQFFPTGKYQNLDPFKVGTDNGGTGCYQSTFGICFQKVIFWFKNHPWRYRMFLSYTLRPPVEVEGFNNYGGGFGTKGKIHLDGVFLTILGLEYSFTQKWVFSLDLQYFQHGDSKFKGYPGVDDLGNPATVSSDKTKQFSLAPALEYNFNADLGLIGGVWFDVCGLNTVKFVSGVISLTYALPLYKLPKGPQF